MHVDVVNAVIRKHVHLDVLVNAVVGLDDVVDVGLSVVWEGGPPIVAPSVFFEDEFGGECRAKTVTHPVAACVHQVTGGLNGAVEVEAHVGGQNIGDGVVVGARAVVQPIDQYAAIVVFLVDGVGAIVTDPNAVGLGVHHFHAVHGDRAAARKRREVVGGLVDVF